ncbi:DUF2490 domain-containing protein [Prosthecochloris sp. N3]|uniref:DUF2490 domain-containing protein n=1 Tax=Prosthecochloris ethylica TaxID=2743976 RepID=A0ABR9XRG6_9CHLB|nr:DUF2490 domain-containing protein [Prosthecochloris ethylica]MBF0636401.1 DUF2490 domain-containing protein [Prosthecochloris ethylica]NUK47575.1 DUF2490 domain-containing protein [Prosthecochloris ethylica]
MLNNILKATFLTAAFIGTLMLPTAQANDTHSWNTLNIKHRLDDTWLLHIGTDQKFVDDMSEHAVWTLFAGAYYQATENLSVGLEARHWKKKKAGTWTEEHRFTPVLVYKDKLSPLVLTFRERAEFRTREGDDSWISRNYLKLALAARPVSPYIANELFYDVTAEKLSENRLTFGLDIGLSTTVKTGLYYMVKSQEKSGEWNGTNVFGTSLTFLW